MAIEQFRLPDLGEGLTEGEILQWLVAPGDRITLNQPIVEIETAKAAVELPSPFAGTVIELLQAAGSVLLVGSPLIAVQTGSPAADDAPPAAAGLAADLVPPAAASPGSGREAVLVGYGVRTGEVTRRPRRVPPPAPADPARGGRPPVVAELPPARVSAAGVGAHAQAVAGGSPVVLAKPPVRRLARDLGVDLATLTGSGPQGTVTRADVETAALSPTPAASTGQRIPVRGVRRATAAAVTASAFTAPHVSVFLDVDVTAAMELRARLAAVPDLAEVRIRPLVLVARAFLLALRRHPEANSSFSAEAIEVHPQVNLGIAAATPRGLLVPVIPAADRMGLSELAREIAELTAAARAGRTVPARLVGGTATITNVGVFGVDTGTPILNPGESVILCVGSIGPRPWVCDGALAVRQVTTLSLSFDHRCVDGELGARVLADTAAALHDPTLLLAWG